MSLIELATIPVDLDTKVHAHLELATFHPIPGVDQFHLAAVVAFLAELRPSDREALVRASARTAARAAQARKHEAGA
ncbi:hypothetical protein ABH931_006103 [Streptacidiphilus sp. MAP12-33]|uniref:hypothetical protein n=1 Tax=Streptacidiphilus sp. MAP12-33 TaxID=3156266 RepID=UPI003513DDAC